MNLDKVLATLLLIGNDLPAFKALWGEVVTLFSEDDQAKLQSAYEAALLDAAKAHEAAQSL